MHCAYHTHATLSGYTHSLTSAKGVCVIHSPQHVCMDLTYVASTESDVTSKNVYTIIRKQLHINTKICLVFLLFNVHHCYSVSGGSTDGIGPGGNGKGGSGRVGIGLGVGVGMTLSGQSLLRSINRGTMTSPKV